jgi:hypothetical protein
LPIISVDLYPTLVELAGGELPADYPLNKVSYESLLTEQKPLERSKSLLPAAACDQRSTESGSDAMHRRPWFPSALIASRVFFFDLPPQRGDFGTPAPRGGPR